jgi:thiamine kinase-like enzyme
MGIVESLYLKITGENPKTIVALQDGFYNTSYWINGDKVFRLKKLSDAPFYSAENEGQILNLVAQNRLSPKVFFFDRATGNMIDRYIDGNHRFCGPHISEDDLKAMAGVLKRLHGIKNCTSEFYAEQRYATYRLRGEEDLHDPEEKKIHDLIGPILRNEPLFLSHNELVHDNILKNKDSSQIVLIDFELAGLNNEMFDLASLLSENEIFDENKWQLLLLGYFGKEAGEGKKKKLVLFMQYENYLGFYGASCHYKETKYSGFKEIADRKKKNILYFKDFYKKHPDFFIL